MRSIKLTPLTLLLVVLFTKAQPAPFFLQTSTEQQGQFVQEKHLAVLTQPFITKGTYHYQSEVGLIWHTQHPVESLLKITTDGVSERQTEGHFKSLTTNSQFSELLLALFSGEQQSLQQQFSIQQMDNTLTLTPKSPKIARIILEISVQIQNSQIHKIELQEPEGNYTNILLSQLNSSEQGQ